MKKTYKVQKPVFTLNVGDVIEDKKSHNYTALLSAGIIEELKPHGRFKPEVGEKYWLLDQIGRTFEMSWDGDNYDHWRYVTNNVFRTEAEALAHKKYLEAVHTVSEYICEENGDWVADWGDENTWKYNVYRTTEGCVTSVTHCQAPVVLPYMRSEELAKSVIEKFPEELKVIFGKH